MKIKFFLVFMLIISVTSTAYSGLVMDIIALPLSGYTANSSDFVAASVPDYVVSPDGKSVVVGLNATPTIVMQVWATVTGIDADLTNDGIQGIVGGIQQTHVQASVSALSLPDEPTNGYLAPFDASPYSFVSVTPDLLGIAYTKTPENSLVYRAPAMQYTTADKSKFLLGTFNFTADSGSNPGGFSTINWVKSYPFIVGAIFKIDGMTKTGLVNSGYPLITVGAPVTVSTIPEPSTLLLLTAGAFGLLAWAWRHGKTNRILPCLIVLLVSKAEMASADVFNMGPGLTSLEMVPVGNVNNAADTRVMTTDGTTGYGAVDHAYAIGKYEVTAGQYCAFLNAVGKRDPYGLYSTYMDSSYFGCQITRHGSSGSYTYDFSGRTSGTELDWANRPVNDWISWGDAARFVNWIQNGQPMGMLTGTPSLDGWLTENGTYYLNGAMSQTALMAVTRKPGAKWWIPTEDEWYKAAYYDPNKQGGADYWMYPTKSNTAPSNVGGDNYADPGNHANYWNGSNYTLNGPYFRTNVGEFENSASAYGTFDQGGNVVEWNETAVSSLARGIRGGEWMTVVGQMAASYRSLNDPNLEDNLELGFRIAGVPEPSTFALLAAGAFGLIAFVWRKRNA
ncbi:MAG: SUMF1/EgtB/PvdO family nonheme iron enzyme [Pirellulales bacterium]|nr:SUMF1/EgtB/PvdO family nonheme iron enzyme [Pirellulales bacterium]